MQRRYRAAFSPFFLRYFWFVLTSMVGSFTISSVATVLSYTMVQPLTPRFRNENMRSMPFTLGKQPLPSVQLKPTKPKMRTMRARSLRTERYKWRRSSRLSFMPRKKGLNSPYPLRYPLLLSRDKRLSVHSPLTPSMNDSHGDSTSR